MVQQVFKEYDDTFAFGIYKGKSIGSVIKDNRNYLRWLIKNDIIKIDNETLYKDADRFQMYENRPPTYGKMSKDSDVIPFGVHKGQTIKEIMKDSASYLLWLEGKNLVDFSKKLRDDIKEMARCQSRYWYSSSCGYDDIDTSEWSAYSVMDMYCV